MSEVFRTPVGEQKYTFEEVKQAATGLHIQFTRQYDQKGTAFYNLNDLKIIQDYKILGLPIEILINVMIQECILSHPFAFESSKLNAITKIAAIRDYEKLLKLVRATHDKYYESLLAVFPQPSLGFSKQGICLTRDRICKVTGNLATAYFIDPSWTPANQPECEFKRAKENLEIALKSYNNHAAKLSHLPAHVVYGVVESDINTLVWSLKNKAFDSYEQVAERLIEILGNLK
ncbi:unnamed protein product [Sphagnum jensenii]